MSYGFSNKVNLTYDEADKYRKLLTEQINNRDQINFQFTGTDF